MELLYITNPVIFLQKSLYHTLNRKKIVERNKSTQEVFGIYRLIFTFAKHKSDEILNGLTKVKGIHDSIRAGNAALKPTCFHKGGKWTS